ncbi:unnamed protein product, partial [Brassica oleracea var. botrytis]
RAIFSFVLLNQSGKEIHRTLEAYRLFCAWGSSWSWPLGKLQEKGFLEKNILTIKLEIEVFDIIDVFGLGAFREAPGHCSEF